MSIEEDQSDVLFEERGEPPPPRNRKRKIFVGLVVSGLLLCGICSATGILNLNFDIYGGGMSIESLVFTDELDELNDPANPPRTRFEATEKIIGLVTTSGADLHIRMRWYHEDTLMFEPVGRPIDNRFATHIEGSPLTPLPAGEYRVEVLIGQGDPIETATFTVEEYELELEVNPPQPTPANHVDIENAPYVEVPFAFDEVWEINGEQVLINEVKITFFREDVLFVVVVDSEMASNQLDGAEAESMAKPIAAYALENGYFEKAQSLEINGRRYDFSNQPEPIVVTLFSRELGGGFRARFEIEDLEE